MGGIAPDYSLENKVKQNGFNKATKDLNKGMSEMLPNAKQLYQDAGGIDIDQYMLDKLFKWLKKDTSVAMEQPGRIVDHKIGDKD